LNSPTHVDIEIPDHELIRCIGQGGYGKVWLGRNVMGSFRAIKVIQRDLFPDDRPYEREFSGIKKFEPISRTHPGFITVLHIGWNHAQRYFYYVMEVADDALGKHDFESIQYSPRTLGTDLLHKGRLPVDEALRVGMSLASALDHLHRNKLVHRDIKPSNIIFVEGQAKFADIGLVSDIGEHVTFVGSEGYVPPEGPGQPVADLFGLGKVLYQLSTGSSLNEFPAVPQSLLQGATGPQMALLLEVIRKACDFNPRKRIQTGQELHDQLARIARTGPAQPSAIASSTSAAGPLEIAILSHALSPADERLLKLLEAHLNQNHCRVFVDRQPATGLAQAVELERRIAHADVVVPLLTNASVESEMLAYEMELAAEASHSSGKPRLIAIQLQLTTQLPAQMAARLDGMPVLQWRTPSDDETIARELLQSIRSPEAKSAERAPLESIGGAVPLDSKFYVVREADNEFQRALAAGESIVLLKGARQMGKTSLLARGLQGAREAGSRVILTDFQQFNASNLQSLESFYRALGDSIADQLDLDVFLEDVWDPRRSPNTNFERYLRREALGRIPQHLVWGLDEVDRLFTCDFGTEVFGLFRSWHNKRALEPQGPWSKLTLAIAYATEAHLFINDLNQSPFNVGIRLELQDFQPDQVAELNRRYGSPLKSADETARFVRLIGGQPFLVRRGLHELATQKIAFADFEEQADRDEGIFGDHLRRILISLAKDSALAVVVKGVLAGEPCPNHETFYRLRASGVMVGTSPHDVRCRCQVYTSYLSQHLI
jgi:serine/threonine protein kinase